MIAFYAFIVSLVCIVIITLRLNYFYSSPLEISLSFLLFRTLTIMKVRFTESHRIVYRVIMAIRALYEKAFALFIRRDDTKGDSIRSE